MRKSEVVLPSNSFLYKCFVLPVVQWYSLTCADQVPVTRFFFFFYIYISIMIGYSLHVPYSTWLLQTAAFQSLKIYGFCELRLYFSLVIYRTATVHFQSSSFNIKNTVVILNQFFYLKNYTSYYYINSFSPLRISFFLSFSPFLT